jgi:hypothetical protein
MRWWTLVLMVLLSGCAVENRLLMPRTPLHGQSESQVEADKRECGDIARSAGQRTRQAYQDTNRNLAIAGLVTGVFLSSDEGSREQGLQGVHDRTGLSLG